MPTETVTLSYNGSDTVVATINNAVIGNTYACTSLAGFVGGSGFVTATGSTLVLTISGISASPGDIFDIFVFNDSLFGGDDFNYLAWTLYAYGTASETSFPATWDYDGDKTISVTFPSSDPMVNYILSVFDESNGEWDSAGTPGNGGDLTISVTLTNSPTPDYFRATLWDEFFNADGYRSVRLFTPGLANDGFPGNPSTPPASSFDDSDTVATVTTVSAPLYYEDSETVATVTNPSIESEYVLHVDGSWGPFDDDDGIII